jgi:hypothetical protein
MKRSDPQRAVQAEARSKVVSLELAVADAQHALESKELVSHYCVVVCCIVSVPKS